MKICDVDRVFLVAVVASAIALCASICICVITYYVLRRRDTESPYDEIERPPKPSSKTKKEKNKKKENVIDNDGVCWTIVKPNKVRFKALSQKATPKEEFPKAVLTKELNRHLDCMPNPKTAVKIHGDTEFNRFINANFVHGANGDPKYYICAQGPLRTTLGPFWQMILQHNVVTVVMITDLTEKGKEKCQRYWPFPGRTATYGEVQVTSGKPVEKKGFVVTDLHASSNTATSRIKHYWFNSWKDHSVPKDDKGTINTKFFLDLREQVRQRQMEETGPILVHCSAGIGRSGSYIALDYALEKLETVGQVDLVHVVDEIRNDRLALVQHDIQYLFIQKAIRAEAKRRKVCVTMVASLGDSQDTKQKETAQKQDTDATVYDIMVPSEEHLISPNDNNEVVNQQDSIEQEVYEDGDQFYDQEDDLYGNEEEQETYAPMQMAKKATRKEEEEEFLGFGGEDENEKDTTTKSPAVEDEENFGFDDNEQQATGNIPSRPAKTTSFRQDLNAMLGSPNSEGLTQTDPGSDETSKISRPKSVISEANSALAAVMRGSMKRKDKGDDYDGDDYEEFHDEPVYQNT
eukprot:m.97678 g.97678  ORF g.97678 m.97678 type:complete len:576 (-) comp13609_c0_seq2:79-1806(-)